MRAFVQLWDEITATRYGVTDPKQRMFRYGVQVNSLGLTEQQPENNVARILIEMLAVTLSKNARARAVQLPAWNEALGLPRPWDQQWSLRMQQILAYESDLLDYGDIFDGSPAIAAKVAELVRRRHPGARAYRGSGRRGGGHRPGLHEAAAGGIQHPPGRGDRARRADRGRRQPLRRDRALAARRRRRCDHDGLAAGRSRPDRAARGLARGARRRRGRGRAEGPARLRQGRPQHHAALDRLRQSRRHHRRMGVRAARGLRRIPGGDRGRARGAQRQRRPRRHPRRRRSGLAQARTAPEVPGRQARPRRPFQRRRADRGARARLRHGRGLRGHPADAGRDRGGGAPGRRACGRALDPVRHPICRW